MKTKLIISGLVFMAVTTLTRAQNNGINQRPQNSTGKGLAYVDANKNGICDNYENRTGNVSGRKRNGSCKHCFGGQKNGKGQMGWSQGQGKGNRRYFVDVNKNGICDFLETPVKK